MKGRKKTTKGYKDLIAWQKGMDLAEMTYKITSDFPREEIYGLISQMRRAAVSVPSNLAEGQLRSSKNEFKQFVSISLGSCGELDTQLELAKRLGYIKEKIFKEISEVINEEMRILHGLRHKIYRNNVNLY
jgi:four helix bundle protein